MNNETIERFMRSARRVGYIAGTSIRSAFLHDGMAYVNIGHTMLWMLEEYDEERENSWTSGTPTIGGGCVEFCDYEQMIERVLRTEDRQSIPKAEVDRVMGIKIAGAKDNIIVVTDRKGRRLAMRKPVVQDFFYYTKDMDMAYFMIPSIRVLYAENLMGEGGICHALEPRDSIRRMEEIVVKVI